MGLLRLVGRGHNSSQWRGVVRAPCRGLCLRLSRVYSGDRLSSYDRLGAIILVNRLLGDGRLSIDRRHGRHR